jgi:hypothetical protein
MDGGVYESKATFRVVISNGKQALVTNYGTLYCFPHYESPTRSELYAILAGLVILSAVAKQLNIQQTAHRMISLYKDNQRMISRIYRRNKMKRTVNQHKDPDLDLEIQIIAELEELKSRGNTVQLYFM